jgi:hypothetical protein
MTGSQTAGTEAGALDVITVQRQIGGARLDPSD